MDKLKRKKFQGVFCSIAAICMGVSCGIAIANEDLIFLGFAGVAVLFNAVSAAFLWYEAGRLCRPYVSLEY